MIYENNKINIAKAKQGDAMAMEQLIQDNMGLIASIVKRFKDRGYELEDLYQIGIMGFIKSIKRFDTDYDVKLSTYAVPYIMGEIKRFLRDDGPIKVSRSMKELGIKIRELQREALEKGKELKVEEIAKKLNVSKEEVAASLDSFHPVESIYNNRYQDEEGGISILDTIAGKEEGVSLVDKLTLKQLIEDLEERDKQLILLRYYKGRTQMQVAKILGITQVQVSRMEKKILANMKTKLAM